MISINKRVGEGTTSIAPKKVFRNGNKRIIASCLLLLAVGFSGCDTLKNDYWEKRYGLHQKCEKYFSSNGTSSDAKKYTSCIKKADETFFKTYKGKI